MSFDLASISTGMIHRPPRIVVLGVEKIGKTTFASGAERPIFLQIKGEQGLDALNVNRFPECQTYEDALQCLCSLASENHDFGTVVIDSASALEPLVWAATCKANGSVSSIEDVKKGFGKGYIEALEYWRRITEALDWLRANKNMASIIVGHVKVKVFNDPNGSSYDQYQFDLNDKAANLLYRWCDVILFANKKVIVKTEEQGFKKEKHQGVDVGGGASYVYTQKRPSHPGGGRGVYGQLSYEIPFLWSSYMAEVSSAIGRLSSK
jgi:hypothetical protein